MRSVIALLLATTLLLTGACDRRHDPARQDEAGTVPDVAAPGGGGAPAPAGTVDRSHKGEAAPEVTFEGPDAKPTSLAAFRGKPVLVNLWATWCAPCIQEMPTLDALAGEGTLKVVAVSQDLEGGKAAAPFLAKHGWKNLAAYADPKLGLSTGLNANLPTTVLYDAAGKELWRVQGAMEWTGADARALLGEAGA
ncbi:TlpA family protein disulfide reductase [Sphingomonas desiccabilis]|uniref:TlpA family protein disulfide reductase n=1 Tax=Sphingomonas desiccabilis TaxID=429134 RepID=UPI0017A4493A|nr:TlpA disulfide reductase family protein [Sphingomonas desiccabilis]MBB3912003.1 thiol-disulfide isomerase/thioredoxin [Sphingomonas desiccabilis]